MWYNGGAPSAVWRRIFKKSSIFDIFLTTLHKFYTFLIFPKQRTLVRLTQQRPPSFLYGRESSVKSTATHMAKIQLESALAAYASHYPEKRSGGSRPLILIRLPLPLLDKSKGYMKPDPRQYYPIIKGGDLTKPKFSGIL